MYSNEVKKHFKDPQNIGRIENADAVGEVGNIACGDVMKLYIDVTENEKGEKIGGGFMCFNRSKKSLTLNTKTEEGLNILKELIKKSDVLLENFRPDLLRQTILLHCFHLSNQCQHLCRSSGVHTA